jgi:hypothetical protein
MRKDIFSCCRGDTVVLEIYEASILKTIEDSLCSGLLRRCVAGEKGGEIDELEV